jgi:Zinc knuckle
VLQKEYANEAWKPLAVKRDHRNPNRIRILCRSQRELEDVKRAAEITKPQGARVLRDQLYPVKMDNVPTRAVLTPAGRPRDDAVRNIEIENGVQIAKIAWLSHRNTGKAYGSMAVFFKTGEQAAAALSEGFFSVDGESANAFPFLPRTGPVRCYKCQQIGHKAFACQGVQTCGNCAKPGHSHSDCQTTIPACAVCRGPHSAFSRNCNAQTIGLTTTLAPTTPTRQAQYQTNSG